jgi:Na+-translocating ferredoxin:NAD+ oxidoreductase RnfC subunit
MELPRLIKYEHWRCTECGRISVVNPANGKKIQVYAIEREIPENDYPKDSE